MMKLFIDNEPHGMFFLADNKSFYVSCEVVVRGFNPLKVPLAAPSEIENTNGGLILATSPETKTRGISRNTSTAFLCLLNNRSYFMVH